MTPLFVCKLVSFKYYKDTTEVLNTTLLTKLASFTQQPYATNLLVSQNLVSLQYKNYKIFKH